MLLMIVVVAKFAMLWWTLWLSKGIYVLIMFGVLYIKGMWILSFEDIKYGAGSA